MFNIKWDTKEFNDKMEKITKNIISNVESSSDTIKQEVYEITYPKAPVYNDILRKTILTESIPFRQVSETRLRQDLIYDAFNPRTGFHYGELRYYETTSGVPRWATIGGERATPLIEKEIVNAVRKGVGR